MDQNVQGSSVYSNKNLGKKTLNTNERLDKLDL